jgi:membrane-associated phospholipid phosphatase
MSTDPPSTTASRRGFLRDIGAALGASVASSVVGLPAPSLTEARATQAAESTPLEPRDRAERAFEIRYRAAARQKRQPLPNQAPNGDEERYPNFIGSYSKALPHDGLGEVDVTAYRALVRALTTRDPDDFDAIPWGGTVKQANPQAALAFELCGADSHHLGMPAPPAFGSEDAAAEMCELYWQALTRDVPFAEYGAEPLTVAAIYDLRRFSRFRDVNAEKLFRGETAGDLVGPYISQFLWKPFDFGALPVTQQYRTAIPGNDFMTSYREWLGIQNGMPPSVKNTFDPRPRYIRNGRDLGEWDHRDFTYQGFLVAALILLGFGPAALDDANPYQTSANQGGFATFGGPHILDLVAHAANLALKAAWYQKWSVHRRLRPEAFGGNVHNHKRRAASYPIHPKLLDSRAAEVVFDRYRTYLLPMAYPEGSPTHPAYPAGHAIIAGACVTVLKAFFKESFPIPNPVQATNDGLRLAPYSGTLTVGTELDKLAANVALGRDIAGVHWRSDAIEGIKLGEKLGLSLFSDYKRTFNEEFGGFSLTTFEGRAITV